MPLDINTTSIIAACLSWLIAFVIFLVHLRTRQIKGPFHWAIGFFLNGIGLALFLTGRNISPFIYLFLANVIMITGDCFLLSGLYLFKGKKINVVIISSLLIAMIVCTLTFLYISPSFILRRFSYSIIMAGYAFISSYELFKNIPRNQRHLYFFLGSAFLILGLGMTTRAILSVYQPQVDAFAPSLANLITFISAIFVQITSSLGYILLINYRITAELEKSVNSKNQIYAILGHDLKSPLAQIIQFTELLERDSIPQEKRQLYLKNLKMLSHTAFNTMENLLAWSRSQTGDIAVNPSKIDLKHVAEKAIDLLHNGAQQKNIRIINDIPEGAYSFADHQMIETVFRNLIMNAIKFSYPGNIIKIKLAEQDEFMGFLIEDNGVGISKDKLDKIFDRECYQHSVGTANESGTGLGLLICRDFILKNKGKILIESVEKKGTRVTILLPR